MILHVALDDEGGTQRDWLVLVDPLPGEPRVPLRSTSVRHRRYISGDHTDHIVIKL